MENQLIPIPYSEWPNLRDLFKDNWPKNCIIYNTIKNYILWFKQDPNLKNVQIYSLNGNFSDGTFIIIDRYHVLFCTLNENFDNLTNALYCLDRNKSYFLYGFFERILPGIEKFFDLINYPFQSSKPDTTDLFYISKKNALQLKYTVPQGLIIKSLTEDNIETINDAWPHKHPGSIVFLNRMMKYNPSLGLFDEKSKELIAWCFTSVFDALLALHVPDKHKRKGYGTILVKAFAKQLAENGLDVCAPVVTGNEASKNMFLKCGFKIIDKLYWVALPSQKNPNYVWNED